MRANTRKSLLLLAIVFIICGVFSSPVYSAGFHSKCWVPYNISGGEWLTGLNITTAWTDEVLTINFLGPSTTYATVTLNMSDNPGRFWTGTPQQLLSKIADPTALQSPTLLILQSQKGVFSVTQFLMNINSVQGFGHQTFLSFPYANEWPYTPAAQPPQ